MEAPASGRAGARPPLAGYRVGVVAHRGRQELAEVLLRLGAEPVLAPVVSAVAVTEVEALEAVTEEVVDDPPALMVFTSAAGVEAWLGAAEEQGRDQALRRTLSTSRVLVQGTATRDATHSFEVTVDAMLSSDSDQAERPLPASVGNVAGRRVAVQFDQGTPTPSLVGRLRRVGAAVVEVGVPVAGLPADPEPALRLLEDLIQGRVEALTFTAPVEVRNLVAVSGAAGLDDQVMEALNGRVSVVCISRACERVAVALGIIDVARPARARVGAMVDALVDRLGERSLRFGLEGFEVVLQGALAIIDGEDVWLTGRERALLAALARRPGMVVTKAELLRRVWRSDGMEGVEGHAVEVAVGRLRRRLGPAGAALQTVPRRGYRLAGD